MRFSPERLRCARVDAGLSRDQLAHAVGRTVSTVTKYEVGLIQPSSRTLPLLAQACGTGVQNLFDHSEPATVAVLTDAERAAIRADVSALPPLPDEAIDAIAAAILGVRERVAGEYGSGLERRAS